MKFSLIVLLFCFGCCSSEDAAQKWKKQLDEETKADAANTTITKEKVRFDIEQVERFPDKSYLLFYVDDKKELHTLSFVPETIISKIFIDTDQKWAEVEWLVYHDKDKKFIKKRLFSVILHLKSHNDIKKCNHTGDWE